MGVPAVKRFLDELGDKVLLWPFQTSWREITPSDLQDREAVIAEVYPALVKVEPEPGEVADRAQVRALCDHFARLDEQGRLGPAFAAPKGAAPDVVTAVEQEEGWILGAGAV
jgi:hypothetical protein